VLRARFHAFHRFFGEHHGGVNAFLYVSKNRADLYGRAFCSIGQIFHLIGHHGKAAALFPSGGCANSGV